jgi:sialidase-1
VTPDAALIDPVCNAGIARYRRGARDLLLFTNAASSRRENLTLKLSADGGRSWTAGRALHPGPAAYSTVIPLRDGTVGVLYERGERVPVERITFARFNMELADSNQR